VQKDSKKALEWYQKAAEKGDADTLFFLGIMYDEGRGVQKNKIQAYKWFNIAYKKGNSEASFGMESLKEEMTVAEIKEAQGLATQWMKDRKSSEKEAAGNSTMGTSKN
jgi:TPR repeat protein